MDSAVVDTSVASHPSAIGADPRPLAHGLDAPTILWFASWFGLAAGFLDLASTILQNCLIHGEFYRLGHGFPWVIPFGVASMVMVPGLLLALVAATRPRGLALWLGVAPLAFLGFLDVIATLPLELWSALLLALGLTVQSVRYLSTRPLKTLRAVRLSTPLLATTLLATAILTSGRHAWSEWSTIASLPPPPRHSKNVILIVWDTVRAKNLSLYGHERSTSPNLERLASRGVRFSRAFATSSWTLPSHASLFTGRWPHELSAGWKRPLDDARPTLAARLSSLGYDTA
ncbi:sulfatase-like hydrolase/transferase, partial [Singulisphaera rosea]